MIKKNDANMSSLVLSCSVLTHESNKSLVPTHLSTRIWDKDLGIIEYHLLKSESRTSCLVSDNVDDDVEAKKS